ncbi:hypothetical protein EG329_006195 [Mollisiaceae sp. DMI_Dod_QoI]|nr:hypothetical protein EG329_006195 [Helotiales sp. DMI_Dod_QoI]
MSIDYEDEMGKHLFAIRYLAIIEEGLFGRTPITSTSPTNLASIVNALTRIAGILKAKQVSDILDDICLDFPAQQEATLLAPSFCDCGRNGGTKANCMKCDSWICATCSYSMLDACIKLEALDEETSRFDRSNSLAAKRIMSPCRECQDIIEIISGSCNCEEILMDAEHKSLVGQFCKNCMIGILDEIIVKNTAQEEVEDSEEEHEVFLMERYVCDCGEIPEEKSIQICKLCNRCCDTYPLHEKQSEADSEGERNCFANKTKYCPYFLDVDYIDLGRLSTVAEAEKMRLAEKKEAENDLMEVEASPLRVIDCNCRECCWHEGKVCRA